MKKTLTLLMIGLLLISCKNESKSDQENSAEVTEYEATQEDPKTDTEDLELKIDPISHATAVFNWGDKVFYTDPVGGAEAFQNQPKPDFVLITDIHGDHMNAATLKGLNLSSEVKLIVPQAVKDELPKELYPNLVVVNNGETINHEGFTITAIPMYNLPQSKDAMHVKGRGNGYVVEKNGKKLYISGDTEDIPEMRNLQDIDVALVSMNLPYTMPVDQAADGVIAFKPAKVIPYHYRGKNGFSDVNEFKKMVNEKNPEIEVDLMDWYPESKS